MDRWKLTDVERGLAFSLADRDATLGALADMSTSERGWFILEGMAAGTRSSWSAGNMAAIAAGSISADFQRAGFRAGRDYHHMIASLITDGLGWLISVGLVGPSARNSGSAGDWDITDAGRQALESGSVAHAHAGQRLHVDLHPALQSAARSNFEDGEYQVAVFAAMHSVEVALREASGLDAGKYGDGLVTYALRPDGPFAIDASTPSETEAFLQLFKGAIGAFKNPASHRVVQYDDPAEAADIVHLADLLLRIIDRERARRESPGLLARESSQPAI